VDWLRAALANNAPWLSNLDEKGCPKKLLKFSSVAAMTAEIDRDILRAARRNGAPSDGGEGTETYMDLGEGWRLVRLLTSRALDFESSIMQHCIGNGGYDAFLDASNTVFLSLRDPHGKPHATVSVVGGKIEELSGKQNEIPQERYLKRLAPLFKSLGETAYLDGSYGIVEDIHGNVFGYGELPEVLEVSGRLWLTYSKPERKYRLPRIIKADGNVVIEDEVFEVELELVVARRLDHRGVPTFRWLPDRQLGTKV
jgi:hypothetical protein